MKYNENGPNPIGNRIAARLNARQDEPVQFVSSGLPPLFTSDEQPAVCEWCGAIVIGFGTYHQECWLEKEGGDGR